MFTLVLLSVYTLAIAAGVTVAYWSDSHMFVFESPPAAQVTLMHTFYVPPAQKAIYNPAPIAWQTYGYEFRFR